MNRQFVAPCPSSNGNAASSYAALQYAGARLNAAARQTSESMSKQLAISASAAILAMAAFVLSATPQAGPMGGGHTQTGATTEAAAPAFDLGYAAQALRRWIS